VAYSQRNAKRKIAALQLGANAAGSRRTVGSVL